MSEQDQRRELEFAKLDEVVAEVRSLAETGYQPSGNWNLAQICEHCALWVQFPMDGFPKAPIFIRPVFWLVRKTIGKRMLAGVFKNGFRVGLPTMPESVPERDKQSEQDSIEQYCSAIERFRNHDGTFHESPLYGKMDRESLMKLQLIHAAHHLSFLIPNLNE